MAERAENQRVLRLLAELDAPFLRSAQCWLGGGTAVSLRCGEFRLSRDVGFLCATREGYRQARERVFDHGLRGLFSRDVPVVREARVDRYGIRGAVEVDGAALKIEIVSEGRIDLDGITDPELPVARLTDDDLVAEKLLANADRFLDDSALGRDAIDLLMLERELGGLPRAAFDKAMAAYGPSVERAYEASLRKLRDRPDVTARWFGTLDVTPEARRALEARLASLGAAAP